MLDPGFKYRNKKILKHARGQDCQMKLPGVCNHNPETVVAAHSNLAEDGKGAGTKAHDLFTAAICSDCHDVYDGRRKAPHISRTHIDEYFHRAMKRTLLILVRDGILR